jgi:hypothetical protein
MREYFVAVHREVRLHRKFFLETSQFFLAMRKPLASLLDQLNFADHSVSGPLDYKLADDFNSFECMLSASLQK